MRSIQNKIKTAKTPIMWAFGVVAGLFLMATSSAWAAEEAQYDDVFINGYKLGFFEQRFIEDVVGHDIKDGQYWLDVDSGQWGPVGSAEEYHIDLPEDYRAYVKENFKQPGQAAKVKLTSVSEECEAGCLYW